MTGDDVVNTARSYVGTKFVHQGRLRNAGIDCLGLLICVGREVGVASAYPDPRDYKLAPDTDAMRRGLCAHLMPVPFSERQLGDVLWFRAPLSPQHLGIISKLEPLTVIHASNAITLMRCLEQILVHGQSGPVQGASYLQIHGCFRFPGVTCN